MGVGMQTGLFLKDGENTSTENLIFLFADVMCASKKV